MSAGLSIRSLFGALDSPGWFSASVLAILSLPTTNRLRNWNE